MYFDIDRIRNVLILMTDKHMGNLVVSLPAIAALKEFFSGKEFFLIVDEAYKEIAEAVCPLDCLIPFPRQNLRRSHLFRKIKTYLSFLKRLRIISPDTIIDLEGRDSSSALTLLSGAKIRVGRESYKRSWIYNIKAGQPLGKHKAYIYLSIASQVGADIKTKFSFHISQSNRESLRKIFLKENILIYKPIACIHPSAGKIYKQWTSSGFAQVGDWLVFSGYQVVFVGGKGDNPKITEILAEMKSPALNLSEKLSIGQLMALIEMSSIFIGNDSGPMHLADKIGVSVVALFGPANEERWGPLSKHSIVLRNEEPCEKCKGKDCQYDFKCIWSLHPDVVINAIEKLFMKNPVWLENTKL